MTDRSRLRVAASLIAALCLPAMTAYSQQTSGLQALDYDSSAPLDIQQVGVEHRGDVAVHDISYASPKGGRVPAYLVVPSGRGLFAAIIWGHWYMPKSPVMNRKEFLDEAVLMARAGVVSLLPDGPIARPGHVEDPDPLSEKSANELIQQIVDMRRGADLLLARKDVDASRLAYVGHSYDAEVGGFLSGLDHRFKAFVLMAGNLSDQVDMQSQEFQQFRLREGAVKFDAFTAKYAWLDPGKFVSHAAPAFVLLQYGSQEKYLNPARARQYAVVVSDPKELKIYDAPHSLNGAARADRVAFLTEQLKLKPVDPALIAAVPAVWQPPDWEQ
jgi:cephalosporin-C deacetylase-like acetyl esterase